MISFIEGTKRFNFRVGAIILNRAKTKVLLHTISEFGFYMLPGGRVEWNESGVEALKRELKEELMLENVSPRERAFIENFYTFKNINSHEISNNFVVELNDSHAKLEEKEEFFGVEGERFIFKWVPLKDIDKVSIGPAVLNNVIKNYEKGLEYIIFRSK